MTSPDVVRCLEHGAASGPRNMAVDEALMDAARAGEVVLRFYRWSPPCLSFGRHQRARGRYAADAAAGRGIDLVRRPTGGRAVYHHREVTYAVAAPADLWGGLRPSYRTVNRALARGLRELGVPVESAPDGRSAPGPSSRACFRDPLPGELVAAGRKLVGSAQWRREGALLQHGSVLLEDDQAEAERLRTVEDDGPGSAAGDGGGSSGAASLTELLGAAPDPGEVAAALRAGFARELGVRPEPGELTPAEEERARRLEERYRDEAWTWRR